MVNVYAPKTWIEHEIIQHEELNHMELGIANARSDVNSALAQMDLANYIDRTVTHENLTLIASGNTEFSDIDTSHCSTVTLEVSKNNLTNSVLIEVFGKVGSEAYTTDPVSSKTMTADISATIVYVTGPLDLIKVKITNQSSTLPVTVSFTVRAIGQIGFMEKSVYDPDKNGTIELANHANHAGDLDAENGAHKTYANIASEIDSDVAAHSAIVTAHHSNVNDPTGDQKAALAGTSGSPGNANRFVTNSDARLSDYRNPLAHTHAKSEITDFGTYEPPITKKTSFNVDFGSTSGTACQGDDSRLSNSRAPTAHAASHKSAGSDPLKIDEFAAPTDNTNLNVTTDHHGLCPKLNNDNTKALLGDGTWGYPTSVSSGSAPSIYSATNGTYTLDQILGVINGHGNNHKSGNVDAIKLDDLAATDDNTDLNATTSAHGLCPKLPNDNTKFLNGVGAWTAPSIPNPLVIGTTAGTACEGNDSRLSNSRAPTAHKSSHTNGGNDVFALDELPIWDSTNCNVSVNNHGFAPKLPNDSGKFLNGAGIWAYANGNWMYNFGSAAGSICQGNDSRLSNARTPTAHASSHNSSGTDQIAVENLLFNDITQSDTSTTKHGLCPKLPNNNGYYLNGQGGWSVPVGTWQSNFGTASGTICQGNDSRLSNARAPTAHGSTHDIYGGSDPIWLDNIFVADTPRNNVSTSMHGLVPKANGDTTYALNGNGSWSQFLWGAYSGNSAQALAGDANWRAFLSGSYGTNTTQFLRNDGQWQPPLLDQCSIWDTTSNNADTSHHGLCPKLNGDTNNALLGNGTWGVPNSATWCTYATNMYSSALGAKSLDQIYASINACKQSFTRWYDEGDLVTTAEIMPYLVTSARSISSIKGYIIGTPEGSASTVDIRKNSKTSGSILSSQISLTSSMTATNGVYQFDATSLISSASLAAGDVLFIVITAVGSSDPGYGLYIDVTF